MVKKVRRSIAAVLIAIAVAVTQIPAPGLGAASGTEFVMNGTTLISYEGTDSSVSIPDYVKTIGQDSFSNNQVLKKVTIPKSVTAIGAGAFSGCENLTEVHIPAEVTSIGSGAFSKCTSLAQLNIDSKNENFICASGALYNKSIQRLYQVLGGRKGEKFTIPDTVKDIDKYAFWGCKQIKNIQIGSGLKQVPDYAFSNCMSLEEMILPPTIESIGRKAFEDCTSLVDVYIPGNVINIHDTAFDGCAKVKFSYDPETVAEKYAENFVVSNVSRVDYEESSESDSTRPSDGFSGSVSNNEVNNTSSETTHTGADVSNINFDEIPDGMDIAENGNVLGKTKISGGQAVVFVDNSRLQVNDGQSAAIATGDTSSNQNTNVSANEVFWDNGADATIDGLMNDEDPPVEKYVIVNGNTIANHAFYNNSELHSYEIPTGVRDIGDFAFARSSLKSMNIPTDVEKIGYGAFYHCDHLEQISIPSSVKVIEPAAFSDTAWFKNWMMGSDVDDFLVVGDGVLIGYKGNAANVSLPSNVKKVAANVFEGHNEIATVSIPDGVVEVGEEAFKDCTSLYNVSGGNSLVKISDRAFLNCPLQTIRIPETVKSIGLKAFSQDSGSGQSDSVVFLGDNLPEISYEKSATRFSNDDYRDFALKSVSVAVVNQSLKEFTDTILDDTKLGFRGVVCSLSMEPTTSSDGLAYVSYVSNGENGIPVTVPEFIWVYGKKYKIERVLQTAYHSPQNKESGEDIEEGQNAGESAAIQNSDESNQSLDDTAEGGIQDSAEAAQTDTLQNSNSESAVAEDSSSDQSKHSSATLNFSSDALGYEIIFGNDEEEEKLIKDALTHSKDYGEVGDNCITFTLSMTDLKGNIPIKKLGKERLSVSMPVYDAWLNSPILAVCLDDNGQLEASFCKQYKGENGGYVTFQAKHFSPYALYQGDSIPASFKIAYDEKIAMKRNAQYSTAYGQKDSSPDTGDNSIEPKWFLVIGLIALAGYLWFVNEPKIMKGRKKNVKQE